MIYFKNLKTYYSEKNSTEQFIINFLVVLLSLVTWQILVNTPIQDRLKITTQKIHKQKELTLWLKNNLPTSPQEEKVSYSDDSLLKISNDIAAKNSIQLNNIAPLESKVRLSIRKTEFNHLILFISEMTIDKGLAVDNLSIQFQEDGYCSASITLSRS